MDVGPVELLIVLAVVLLLFGSKKLPELAKGMGQAAKEFRSGLNDEHEPEKDKAEAAPAALAVEATAPEVLPVEAAPTVPVESAPTVAVESAPSTSNN
jgi:sec-independent protein translocase protein TatA